MFLKLFLIVLRIIENQKENNPGFFFFNQAVNEGKRFGSIVHSGAALYNFSGIQCVEPADQKLLALFQRA